VRKDLKSRISQQTAVDQESGASWVLLVK
jgi:hypothetical protein